MYSTCNKQDFFLLHFCCITHSFCRMPSWDAGGTTFLPTVWPSILILFFRNIEQGYPKHSSHRQHPYHWNQRERCVGAHRKDSQPSQGFGFLDQVPLNLKPLRKTLFLSFQVDSLHVSESARHKSEAHNSRGQNSAEDRESVWPTASTVDREAVRSNSLTSSAASTTALQEPLTTKARGGYNHWLNISKESKARSGSLWNQLPTELSNSAAFKRAVCAYTVLWLL